MNRVYVRKGAFFSDTKVIILFDFSKRKCSFFHRKKYGMLYPTFARPQSAAISPRTTAVTKQLANSFSL